MFYLKINSRRHFFLLACLIACLFSCTKEKNNAILYPIDSLLSSQIAILDSSDAVLHKQAALGSNVDTATYKPLDLLSWEKELSIFRQLDVMNKPINHSSYLVDDGLYDPGSNLTVKAFTSLKELPVRSMRVFYDDSVLRPRKIEAIYDEENTLYKSSRQLTLEFQVINNKNVLTSYSIHGGQKMILADTVIFSVRSKIQIY